MSRENPRPLAESRRREAFELLRINQRLRVSATWTLLVALLLATAGTLGAILAREAAVLLPLPAASALLCALGFQQFADVSVIGAARRRLEQLINSEAEEDALVYETTVAGVRQALPLVTSVRVLQASWAVVLLALLIAASRTAYSAGYPAWVPLAYTVLTVASLLALGASYRDMLRSGLVAETAFASEIVMEQSD